MGLRTPQPDQNAPGHHLGHWHDRRQTASTWQQIAFTATYNLTVPGTYWLVVQSNGTTAKLATLNSATNPTLTGSATGTLGTAASITCLHTTYFRPISALWQCCTERSQPLSPPGFPPPALREGYIFGAAMTANTTVRTATAIADPNNPSNVLVPAFTSVQVVTPSTTTNYNPVLISLVAATLGNVSVVLEKSTTPVVIRAAAGVPIPNMRIVQVRTTGTTVTSIKGLS